jgi:hypothetical protein
LTGDDLIPDFRTTQDPTSPTWSVRVTSGTRDRAEVHARRHRFVVGRPVEFDVESESISALEYLLGALGADLVAGFAEIAGQRRVDVGKLEAVVEGQLDNALTRLAVVGESGHPGLSRARVKLYVSSLDPEEALRSVWRETLDRSPLACTLRDSVQLELTLQRVV